MGKEDLSRKNSNSTHASVVLENEHVVGVQTQGPVLFALYKYVLGDENDAHVLMVRTFDEQILN